ncbi:MAG TPA: hypothetical protein VM662_02305 [Sphingomonas sp.]|nr:hypothetical protein [Sphingomonas sp.]
MAMLGDLLVAARDSAGGFHAWLHGADPELAGQVTAAAAREGLARGAWTRVAVADFARFASEEDWTTLISAIRDDADPGSACLMAMVHWRLTVSGCAQHSAGHIEAA